MVDCANFYRLRLSSAIPYLSFIVSLSGDGNLAPADNYLHAFWQYE
ncbi:hypothetical protein [Anabaena catenula]|nr:hypothetical protein [Anabaena catenula]